MSRKVISLSAISLLMASTAVADVPSVAADIAPVHSLVARIMSGVGEPNLIIPAGASPHSYSLKPSDAKSLQEANVVFWIGEDLTPWMEGAVETLAANADVVTLLEQPETKLLDFREGALFEEHDHSDHDDHDDHAKKDDHDDHDDHDHDKKDDHDDHDDHDHDKKDDHDDHAEHDHGEHNPHAWLSTENAKTWLNLIAARLSAIDPENAGTYFANAAKGREEIDVLIGEINATLDPVRGKSFVVFHDAYQYFETSFKFPASGAISLGDATDPSPARISEIQERVQNEGINCVLSEPQYNPGLVQTVLAGTESKTGVIDPLGVTLEPGASLYENLLRNMAKTLAGCL